MSRVLKAIVFVFTVVLVVVIPAGVAKAADLRVEIEASDLTIGETLLLSAVGYAFGWDTDVLVQYRSETGTALGAVTLIHVAEETGIAPERIVGERRKGRSWDEIIEASLPPGLRKKGPNHPGRARQEAKLRAGLDAYEVETTARLLAEYYAVQVDDIYVWIDAGLALEEVSLSLNFAARLRRDPEEIVFHRRQGRSWEWIAHQYGVRLDTLVEVVPPAWGRTRVGR